MRIGIIEAGAPPSALVPTYGTYVDMTRGLLGPGYDFSTYAVFDGAPLPEPTACDAFVVTGSSAGVYDRLAWIAPLEDFLRAAAGRTRLVGICFGHQIMAQAFGGSVKKAPQGWSLGVHRYEIRARASWMDADLVHATASHQDQVLTPPPRSRTLAASAFTSHAMIAYEDHPSISMQFHPEFAPDFSRALFAQRRAPNLSEAAIADAMASLEGGNDNSRVARWLDGFLRH